MPDGRWQRPVLGSIRPAMMRSSVDLPQPEGPTMEMNSPAHISKLMACKA